MANLPNLDNLFPKSTGSVGSALSSTEGSLVFINEPIHVGAVVIPTGDTIWHRRGSARLPKGSLPYGMGKEPLVSLAAMTATGMGALQGPSLVLSVSEDGERIQVRHQESGRTSVFSVANTRVLPTGT